MSTQMILVVDDEPLVAEYLSQVLRDMGFATAIASDVASAMALFEKGVRFCAAFVDLGLTDRSGLELVAELQLSQPNLPVVLATGYAKMAESDHGHDGKPPTVLAKPYDAAAVKSVLLRIGLAA